MASSGSDGEMSEETFNYLCTSCADENVIKEGIKYCVDCKGYCCKNCVSLHQQYPPLKKHSLLDITSSQQSGQAPKLPSFPTERCNIHQGKIIDMYCGDCGAVGCYACIGVDHTNCTDIHSIPEDVDQITKDGEFDETSQALQTITDRLRSNLQKSTEIYMKNLQNARQSSLLAIIEHRREIDDILDRLEEDAKVDVETVYSQLKSQLENLNERMKSCLKKYEELMKRQRRSDGNKSQKFVCTKLADATITSDRPDIAKVESELVHFERERKLSFVADASLTEFLQQLQKFGKVNVKDASALYRIKQSEDIVVKIPSDTKRCNITGCCLFGEKELIMSDNSNRKLKRVYIENVSVVDYIDLPHDIAGVCYVENNEVAVACWDKKMIQFVTVGQTMTPSRQVKLNHICCQVAYMDNTLYVSEGGYGGSVYIYDMTGKLLQTVSKDRSGNVLCLLPDQIAICDSEDMVCVAGFDRLVFLDKKGNHLTSVTDADIDQVRGVCVDGRGNALVTSMGSDKIVQFRVDGTKIGMIVIEGEDGISHPDTLCFHQKLCKLFVTQCHNDKIKMIDLM